MASPTFCILPWLSIAVKNNGDYRVCCHANTSRTRGLLQNPDQKNLNASESSINEARNSETLKEIRRDMLQGKWPESCGRCMREEKSSIRSKRIYSKESLPIQYTEEWAQKITKEDGTLDLSQAHLVDLDIRFGNKCNLACRMCGPSDSSAWIPDYEKLGGKFKPQKFNWYEENIFWESLEKSASTLDHIYIVGGEPLLIDRHYVFLNHLIEIGRAPEITLEYNSNLTVLPQKALDLWKHFKKVRIGVSIDGYGAVNDYIRYPSKFSVLENNLNKIDVAPGNLQVWLALTVSIYNLHHLVDMMKWVKSKNFTRIGKTKGKDFFVPHPVHQPEYLNIQALSPQDKALYKDHLLKALEVFLNEASLSSEEAHRAQDIINKYLHLLDARNLEDRWAEFTKYTQNLDAIRGQSFKSLNALFRV